MTGAGSSVFLSDPSRLASALGLAATTAIGVWLITHPARWLGGVCISDSASTAEALWTADVTEPFAWRAALHGLGMTLAMTPALLWGPLLRFARARNSAAQRLVFVWGFTATWIASGVVCLAVAAMLGRITDAALAIAIAIAVAIALRLRRAPRREDELSSFEPAFDAGLRVGAHCARGCGALTVVCLLLPMNAYSVMTEVMVFMALDREILRRARPRPFSCQ